MMRGRMSRWSRSGLGFALLAYGLAAVSALAQSLSDRQRELAAARAQADQSSRQAKRLETQAANEASAAQAAQFRAAALAARIQATEAKILEAEAKQRLIAKKRELVRARLAERQRPAIRLTAALQTLASRPLALALVQPGTTRDLVHVRMLLASLGPEIKARTAGLREDLNESRQLEIAGREVLASLAKNREILRANKSALVRLAAEHRVASSRYAEGAMAEQDRAIAMGEKARDIIDLIDQLGTQSLKQAALERLPGPILRPNGEGDDDRPIEQGVMQSANRMTYRLPVAGTLATGLGELSASGARAKGLTLRTPERAQVSAPKGGRIVFAGPFKGYDQIVIIDHGSGWTSLITGLSTLDVRVGERVIDASPLGRTGTGTARVTIELRRGGRPVDITAFVS